MRCKGSFLASWLIMVVVLLLPPITTTEEVSFGQTDEESSKFSRDDFPPDFIFGAGTSAYQVEGAAAEDGRAPSIWDTFTHAGKMPDNSTGDVASDQYHKYKEDVKLMADMGLDSYRFSISWSRLLPNGSRGAINPAGLTYYNNLIDELLKYGIKPRVTLYHLDLPQVIQDEYGGWLSHKIVEDFRAYADVCFREFGDRVSQWTTIVEPNVIGMSYDNGVFPPNRCSYPFGVFNCTAGDSTTEPYIAVHNILLSHASAVALYRNKYQAKQNGQIGLNLYSFWCYPMTNSTRDIQATQRSLDFLIGWIINPLINGDYPKIMRRIVRSRLPSFTKEQSEQVKGAVDYIGLNHYMSLWVNDNSNASKTAPRDFSADIFATFAFSKNDTPSGQLIPTDVPSDPAGLKHMLEYLRDAYGNPPVYVEENGYGSFAFINDPIHDVERINYLSGYMGNMLDAIRNGANVKGYYVWSFVDVYELFSGYLQRYGLYYVDYRDQHRRRQPKLSALWYSNFLKTKNNNNNNNNPQPITINTNTRAGGGLLHGDGDGDGDAQQ